MLYLAWQAEATASWVGPTMAISLGIIALAIVGAAAAIGIAALRISAQARELRVTIQSVQGEVADMLRAARRITEQGQELVALVRTEAGAYAHTGRQLRHKVEQGADRLEEKLHRLESLYDVVQEEVEDTALNVAATLRSARDGGNIFNRVRHIFTSRR